MMDFYLLEAGFAIPKLKLAQKFELQNVEWYLKSIRKYILVRTSTLKHLKMP